MRVQLGVPHAPARAMPWLCREAEAGRGGAEVANLISVLPMPTSASPPCCNPRHGTVH